MSVIPKSTMQTDLANLVDEWGTSTRIRRFSSSIALDGRRSGAFVSVATEVLWIQPISGMSLRPEPGIEEEITHMVFQRTSGAALRASDKLLVVGETYELDVKAIHIKENHNEILAKRVKRD